MIRYLAIFPEAQARAHEEVTQILGDARMATLANEPQMPYIKAVIKETLWLCPMATTGLHQMADGDVNFKPERYLNHPHQSAVYAAGGDIMAHDHFTFSAGRRIYLGIHLAENRLFLAVSNLIWAYKFKLPLDEKGNKITLDISDEGFMEGAIRVPKQYTIQILERNPAGPSLSRNHRNRPRRMDTPCEAYMSTRMEG
ncbi:hypothetical protein CNMCM6457_004218 [Aspergillus fumigatiaffinis]|nr:hypothetical protein CNMCM6457_004218 [Aspergillus fumigatiaffinis]